MTNRNLYGGDTFLNQDLNNNDYPNFYLKHINYPRTKKIYRCAAPLGSTIIRFLQIARDAVPLSLLNKVRSTETFVE